VAIYHLTILKAAIKDLQNLEPPVAELIVRNIEKLSNNPRPPSSKKLKGAQKLYRLRVREWRVIYEINDDEKTVTVIHVYHRKDAYKKL